MTIKRDANNDPQELSSLFGGFGEGQQQGGIGNLVGGLLGGGGSGNNQNSSQQQQQQKKKGGLGDMLSGLLDADHQCLFLLCRTQS